jgi:tRNA (cmo5U34)-methyltransferase
MNTKNNFDGGEITYDYDFVTRANPHHDLIQQAVADAVKGYSLFAGQRTLSALEIGTGTGITAMKVLQAVPNLELVCVDKSQAMLQQAKRKFTEAGFLERTLIKELKIEEALAWTEPETYDVAFSAYTLHNIPENKRREILFQIYRSIRTGGIFVLSDKLALDDPVKHQENVDWYLGVLDEFFPESKQQAKKEILNHARFDELQGQRWVEAQALHDLYDAGFKQATKLYREKMEAGFLMWK